MLAIVTVKLLRSRFFAINQPITEVVPDEKEVRFIHILAEQYLKPIDLTIATKETVLWWILLLGRMGGHQGFKQKGLPGWQSMVRIPILPNFMDWSKYKNSIRLIRG